MSLRTDTAHRSTVPRPGERRGSTLIVVIALLASLMLLGFLFLTIASQEQENAYLFAEAAKVPVAMGSDYFDFALEQLILGARDDYYNSALWGGRASLLPTMFGNDLQPYNGAGVNLAWRDFDYNPATGANGPDPGHSVVDQEFDGSTATTYNFTNILLDGPDDDYATLNLSPAAWFANGSNFTAQNVLGEVADTVTNPQGMGEMPAADVEYTYPDLSSPFLAYVSYEPTTGKRIVIPSFHRPQYMRELAEELNIPTASWSSPTTGWYANADMARRSMRPHRAHIAVTDFGNSSGETRFVGAPTDADAAEIGVFPFEGSFNGSDFTTDVRDEGVWWGNIAPGTDPQFEIDADNDGLREAVLIDLDYPVQQSADGTTTFVPLFAITVYDADALFNLNAHGNAYGDLAMHDGTNPVPFGDADSPHNGVQVGVVGPTVQNDYISRSNQAVGPHTVNAEVGLDAPVASASGTMLDPHTLSFGHVPTSDVELANMEWWFILAGRADIDTSLADPIKNLYAGRWGEQGRLRAGVTQFLAGPNRINAPTYFPYPGASGVDDDGDGLAGGGAQGGPSAPYDPTGFVFPTTFGTPPYRQPLDYRGQGRTTVIDATAGRQGKDREFNVATYMPFRLPTYLDYAVPASLVPGYSTWRDANLVGLAAWRGLYSNAGDGLGDHPNETALDATSPNAGQDSIFSAGETATLQFSNSDQSVLSFSERLLTLAPYNFGFDATKTPDPAAAQARRKMYTTASSDLKTYGDPVHTNAVAYREWEYDPEPANPNNEAAFPPDFPVANIASGQSQPFREEAQALLRNLPGGLNTTQNASQQTLVRKLSVNHVAEQITNPSDPAYNANLPPNFQRVRLRPLTPHPVGLPSAAIGRPAALQTALPYTAAGPSVNPGFGVMDLAVSTAGAAVWQSAGNPALQEWHARRDRQNLARDIYALLYTIGKANATAANNPVTATNTITWADGNGTVYSLRELREMAQFAVNVVDAMDPDDTITCFVYDLNLYNGYTNLDDGYASPVSPVIDPTNHNDPDATVDADGDGIADNDFYDRTAGQERGVVYGVETQKLAFGEALAIFAKPYDTDNDPSTPQEDHKATDWNDEKSRDFAFVELQNMTPGEVKLEGGWSIVCTTNPTTTGMTPPAPPTPRAVTLNDPSVTIGSVATYTVGSIGDAHNEGQPARSVPSDPRTPWSSTSPTQTRPSHFAVDLDHTGSNHPANFTDYNQIAPLSIRSLDFDLMAREGNTATQDTFRVNDVDATDVRFDGNAFGSVDDISEQPSAAPTSPKAGGWMNLGPHVDLDGDGTPDDRDVIGGTVTFQLRRRLNLDRVTPAQTYAPVPYISPTSVPPDTAMENDNPWVVVDTITVDLDVFDPNDTMATLQAMTDKVKSQERDEPLANLLTESPEYTTTLAPLSEYNNLGVPSVGPKNLWQPHYDRPFASLGELLGVPLYGPAELTDVPTAGSPPIPGGLSIATVGGPPILNRRRVAAARVLFPDGGTGGPDDGIPLPDLDPIVTGFYDNLWYRLFEYVSVPEADGGRQNYEGSPWFTIDGGFPVMNARVRQRVEDEKIGGPHQRFGKLNLNTLRHPHVFAGMIDDFGVMDRPEGQSPNMTWFMLSESGETLDRNLLNTTDPAPPRQWWNDFLISRDGYDPYTGLVLPGLPVGRTDVYGQTLGRPFRSTSLAIRSPGGTFSTTESLQDTIFRRLPGTDVNNGTIYTGEDERFTIRGLFELGAVTESDDDLFDFTTRYRLLSKVLNHSTTRSNVFLVFIDVKFFKAKQKPTSSGEWYVRIGEYDDTLGTARAFFVVDRTKALDMITTDDLPQSNEFVRPGAAVPLVTSSFARNADGSPTFDWRELILSGTQIE